MKSALAVILLALCLTVAAGANAAIITSTDGQGRRITFDVRAAAVDTNWYADVLRGTAHGNEISNLTIRIVPDQQIDALCGDAAAACYEHDGRAGPTIYIPAGKSQNIEGTLVHEYGHHVDASRSVPGIPELNGTPAWWAARGMAALLSSHQVAFNYSLGWEHSIAEIFAEDYASIHVGPSYHYAIPWLKPPDDALKAAIFAELGTPTSPLPDAPNLPLVVSRVGTLAGHNAKSVPFGLLGPGRRVTFTATVSRPQRKGVRARMQIVCNNTVVATRTFTRKQSKRTLDVPNLGPATCDARLVNTVGVSLKYTLKVQLAVEGDSSGG
jgi:hypothetical protein